MILKSDIIDIEKPDGICLLALVVNIFFVLNIRDLHK